MWAFFEEGRGGFFYRDVSDVMLFTTTTPNSHRKGSGRSSSVMMYVSRSEKPSRSKKKITGKPWKKKGSGVEIEPLPAGPLVTRLTFRTE